MTQKTELDGFQNEVRVPIESNAHVEALFTKAVTALVFERLKKLAEKYPLPGVRLALNEVVGSMQMYSSEVENRNLRLIAKAGIDINEFEAVRLASRKKGVGFDLVCQRMAVTTPDELSEES